MINFSHKTLKRMTRVIFVLAFLTAGGSMISTVKAYDCGDYKGCQAACSAIYGGRTICRQGCETQAKRRGFNFEVCK
jgi:hypothetical protein